MNDNGNITYIIQHQKFYESMTFWIGEQWQEEFKQLTSVYFHSKDKG
jgi:hypothetical protein